MDANLYNNDHSIVRFNLLTSLLAQLNKNDENDTNFVIARYFLLNLTRIKNISIYKIAEDCYVSRSSVQRFIKSIGYDSFTQMKASLEEVIAHENAFIDYTDHAYYREYISDSINEMIEDIAKTTGGSDFKKLLNYFLKAENVVILTAEDSSYACKLFQQQVLTTGKLIRIITSASKNISLLETLKKDDLLLVCSVTGNFALAIDKQLDQIKARKCLITMNRTATFEKAYSFIYYLSNDIRISSRNIIAARNVYNNYGLNFFFDIFYHECYVAYSDKNKTPA
ncbi:MAG: MurR/RpiR family transcriptional regulator [Erysipelotrichaceae bacterium]|nr:MurR/RpiR family transcriptional regulator [Erysipelotrichaceae bacterium]